LTNVDIKNYSKNSAYEIGYENLRKPHIKKYIEKRLKEKESARIASQDEVLETLLDER
jgi:phage terminase small subunit